jgi:Asp-tRNA(Asn)/Glu-tRNA(Gln) amidotransferase A subunit family amidase
MSRFQPLARTALLVAGMSIPAQARAQLPDVDLPVVELSVQDVRDGLASGRFTAVELTRSYLARIERYERRYNAFISFVPDALDVAAALDREYAASGPRGPLHGVPVVIKDNIDYAGVPTTAGWEGFSAASGGIDMVPGDDAVVVTRLRAAGAIVLGKTNLPDFARDGTRTRSSVAGETLNPYDVAKVPGGSSGGTATAVNASFAVLGLGTETGGSIQNPASAQGLVGVKPTHGLVPLEGVVPVSATYLDVVGPIARTVADAATVLDVIAGPSDEDFASYAGSGRIPEGGYAAVIETASLDGRRLGLFGPGWRIDRFPLDTLTERLYASAVETAVALGAVVVEDPFRGSGFLELYDERPDLPTGGWADLNDYLRGLGVGAAFHSVEEWERLTGHEFRPSRRTDDQPVAARRPDPGARVDDPAGAYLDWRQDLVALFRQVLADNDLDALFFPQAAAPNRDLVEDPSRPDYAPNNWPEIPSNIVNDLGVPVVTLPHAYYPDGTPFAVAWIGDSWTEAELLGYASVFEAVTQARRAPTLSTASAN